MVNQDVIASIRRYFQALIAKGLEPSFGVLFGSQTRGDTHEWSDIDLVVIARRYDEDYEHKDVALLWGTAALTDPRIEPIPCGVKQWEKDDGTPILEVARREGVRIELKE
ncbi:MAG: nucleotidyltransferase domain-containing protein [Calditrichota bacterium]